MQCTNIEIIAWPYEPPKVPPQAKQQKYRSKYWCRKRTKMLAVPNPRFCRKKYIAPPIGPPPYKVAPEISKEMADRADHVSRPTIRLLTVNKKCFKHKGKKFRKKMNKLISKSWKAMPWMYYRRKLREKKLKKIKRDKEIKKAQKKDKDKKKEEEKAKKRQEHLSEMSKPKRVFKPKPLGPKKWKALEQLLPKIQELALPKEYDIPPPVDVGKVKGSALKYEITEQILKLAELPESRKYVKPEPESPTGVNPRALRAKITPRIEKMATPREKSGGKGGQDDEWTWTINPNALKYKATPRILELAKPSERD